MKSAMIDSLERGPRFTDFSEPVVANGETLAEVTAAGSSPPPPSSSAAATTGPP